VYGTYHDLLTLLVMPLVQVSFLGFCGTMGADYIDYIIADNTVIPPHSRAYYQERVIAMPHSYFVNDHRQSAKDLVDLPTGAVTRAQYGISEDKFVFCNFNQLYKIDPATFDVWVRMLKRVPNSVLWLLRFPPVGEQFLLAEARKRGVREDQIVFSDVATRDEHIKRGYLADLFLDTPVCNAHTTACDIL
jgi:protein O-GlcNAc transferase